MKECRVCLGPHDGPIHAATVSVHKWFRKDVLLSIEKMKPAAPRVPPAVPRQNAPKVLRPSDKRVE